MFLWLLISLIADFSDCSLLTRDKRDGLGVWLRILGLENPVPVQEEVDRARPGLCSQVLVVDIYWYNWWSRFWWWIFNWWSRFWWWIFIGTIGEAGSGGGYLIGTIGEAGSGGGYLIGEAGSGGGAKITGVCQEILAGLSTCFLGRRRARWWNIIMEMWVLPGMQLELSYKCELGWVVTLTFCFIDILWHCLGWVETQWNILE